MPKESTHLYLAATAENAIKEAGTQGLNMISEIISSYPHLFAAGSVAPDSIFNYLRGDASTYLSRFLKYSHDCRDHHLFSYFERFADLELPFKPSLAFAAGTLCHLTADMVFHPVVFYFTGNDAPGEKEALIRHFHFESGIDRIVRWLYPRLKKTRLSSHFRRKEMPDGEFAAALEAIHIPTENTGEVPGYEFISMYRQHCRHESFYGKRFFNGIARILAALPVGASELTGLMYADKPGTAGAEGRREFLEKKIEYRNPVTGADFRKSFNELERDFADLLLDFLMPLGEVLYKTGETSSAGWKDIVPAVKKLIPRDPETGQPCPGPDFGESLKQEMSFFSLRTFEEVWL